MTSRFCLFILLLYYPANPVLSCLDDQCRELEFPATLFFFGERLIHHEIRTIEVIDKDSCELSCYVEHNCVSINFKVEASLSGKHNCDLNKATHKENENDLVKAAGYIYHGTINACGKAPCKNNGICQSGFTSKGYRCLCTSGFIGHDCEYVREPTVTTVATPIPVETPQQQGAAGPEMPTSCVPQRRCGTHAPGWLNGGHPKVTDGEVTRKVCFHWSSNCCYWSINIQVRNCGSFYVYQLRKTLVCSLRYCGTGYHS